MKLMIMLLVSAATGAVEAGWTEGKCQAFKTKTSRWKKYFKKVEIWKNNCSPPVARWTEAKCENFKTNKWKKSFNRVAKWKQECLPPPYKFTSKDDLKMKLQAFNDDAASTEATYGPVAGWDVSGITDMSFLFSADETGAGGYWSGITNDFNADISDWDTSAVTNMRGMFQVCAALSHGTTSSPSRPSRISPKARPAPRTALCIYALPLGLSAAHTPRPRAHLTLACHPFDSVGRDRVRQAAELRHVQRHGHALHVRRALAVRVCLVPPQ